jgi:hypothetical protein
LPSAKLTVFRSNRSEPVAWKKLTGTDGRTYHVNVDHIAFILAQPDGSSWINFAGRGDQSIGMIVVRATPAEILGGAASS